MENYSDQDWIRLLKQGNEQACEQFEQACKQLWEYLLSCAQIICRKWRVDEEIGADAAAATYEKIMLKGIYQFAFRSKFKTYCGQIVTHEIYRELEKGKRTVPIDEIPEDIFRPGSISSRSNEQSISGMDVLKLCVEHLPAREKMVILKYYRDEHSPNEIASDMSITQNYVNVLNHRARKKLLKCLIEHGYSSLDSFFGQSE